jgi:hypothetical protein
MFGTFWIGFGWFGIDFNPVWGWFGVSGLFWFVVGPESKPPPLFRSHFGSSSTYSSSQRRANFPR